MKYTTEIDINKPIDKVIELFDIPDNMSKWMDGLQSFESISGTPGQVGSKSKLKFKMGKREIEMIETITIYNLPDEFKATYEAKGVFNIVKNRFLKITDSASERYLSLQKEHAEILLHAPLKYIASFLGITDTSLSRIRKEVSKM